MAEKKKKPKMIGHIMNMSENVKPEYLSKNKARIIIVEIYENKRFGAVAKIYERNSLFDRIDEKTTKAERKRISESISKDCDENKPVDTSKWVKPDEETIKNALVESLFFLEMFKEDHWMWQEKYGRANAFYSLLHGHSPKNPQMLMNWHFHPYFKAIMAEVKSTENKKYWNNFKKELEKKHKNKTEAIKYQKDRQKNYQIWKKDCLSKMIIKDPKPHKYVNIFKDIIPKSKSKKQPVKKDVKK